MQIRTNSEIACFKRCSQEHFHRYIQLRRPRLDAVALSFGRYIHSKLEGVEPEGTLDAFEKARADAMLAGYNLRYPPLDFHVKEHFWQRAYFAGKCDGVIVHNGRTMLLEHKTTTEDIAPGSDYWVRVAAMDEQITMYLWGLQNTEYATDTCLYNVLKKPAVRPKKNETVEQFYARCLATIDETYFQRMEIVRTEAEIRDFEKRLMAVTVAMEVNGIYRNPASCLRYGRPCDYLPVCSGQTTIENEAKYRTAESAHEELAEHLKETV